MDDVLLLSQSQRGIFAPVAIDLDALCQTIIDELGSNPEHVSRLDYHCGGPTPHLLLDQRLLRQVITNLITNALKYSPPEKQVHIALEQRGAKLILAVCDEGIGIPAADISYLFRPFYRAGNVGKISGTGLGLAIAKEAVERHGGTISVQSELGVGTMFTVSLPVLETT
ncbi:MAG: sensor histidine kinase, partial [Microbacteriaceae bacterium]|nr:sensor histidine kinase [Microbacteriaceae bacterium]